MAYQPYYSGYQQNPYYPGPVPDQLAQLRQQQMQQSMMQQPVQPMQTNPIQQPAPQNGGINWVGSKTEADNWPIAPGCAVALWDSNNPVIYLRQADSTGKPSTKVYDLVERTDNPAPQQAAPQIDWDRIVTWDKLDEYLADKLKRPAKAAKVKEDTEEWLIRSEKLWAAHKLHRQEEETLRPRCCSTSKIFKAIPWSSCKASSTAVK